MKEWIICRGRERGKETEIEREKRIIDIKIERDRGERGNERERE